MIILIGIIVGVVVSKNGITIFAQHNLQAMHLWNLYISIYIFI